MLLVRISIYRAPGARHMASGEHNESTSLPHGPEGRAPNVSPGREAWVADWAKYCRAPEARHSPARDEPEMISRENRVR